MDMVPEDILEKVAVTKLKLDKDRKAKGRVATDKEKGPSSLS